MKDEHDLCDFYIDGNYMKRCVRF